jgi:hypothetical protein
MYLQASSGYVIICMSDLVPGTHSTNLGDTAGGWNYIYGKYLGDSSHPFTHVATDSLYLYHSGTYGGYVTSISGDMYLNPASGKTIYLRDNVNITPNLTIGSGTHDSDHNFKLYIWDTGTSTYVAYDAYIANW